MIFNTWFGYFELCWLSLTLTQCWLFSTNVWFWSLSTSTGLSDLPVRNLQHETSQTTFDLFDQSQHLLHTAEIFLKNFGCIFIFLEIMKHNMLKMLLFSSIFNINGYTNTHQFWSFLKCMLTQFNLQNCFKWSQRQLNGAVWSAVGEVKDNRCYYSHLTKKWMKLLANPIILEPVFFKKRNAKLQI